MDPRSTIPSSGGGSGRSVSPSTATATKSPQTPWYDYLSTKFLPNVPPRLMSALEGWGFDSLTEKDLINKVFIITGGNSGIGKEASLQLAQRGAHVIIASPDLHQSALHELQRSIPDMRGRLDYIPLDLSSLQSIRRFVDDFRSLNLPLNGLLCNAALQLRTEEKTHNGFEQRWGTNFIGHVYLAHLLLDHLAKSSPAARIVFMTSVEEANGWIPWDDPLGQHSPPGADWYASSKLANLMIGLEMGRRLHGTGVDVFVVHPGISQTGIFHKFDLKKHPIGGTWRRITQAWLGQSAYRGALPLVYAAAEPSLERKGGIFIGPWYYGQMMVLHAYSFFTLTPRNPEGRSPHARFRLYEQTIDALESYMGGQSIPNRLRGVTISAAMAAVPEPPRPSYDKVGQKTSAAGAKRVEGLHASEQ